MSRMIRLICTLFLAAITCAAQTSGKKRVAVLDFDYGTVQSYVSSIYGSNQDVGKGITDMLVEKLVKDGKYSVIERKALDKILAEQNFSNSDRADASSPRAAASQAAEYLRGGSPVACTIASTSSIRRAAVANSPEWMLNAARWFSAFGSR